MDLKTRIVISTKDQTKAGNASVKSGLDDINKQLNKVRSRFLAAFSITAGALFLRSLGQTSDEYKEIKSRVDLATDSQRDYNRAQESLFKTSQQTRTGLKDNAVLFNRVNRSIKELGGTQERSLRLTNLITKAQKIGGESYQTSSEAIRQLTQGLGSGVLRGQEYNSVLEGSNRVAQALADGLGVTIGQMREMADAGELTTQRVLAALESQADKIDEEFTQVPLKIKDALVIIENGWLRFIGRMDEGAGASATIAESIAFVGQNLEQLAGTALHAAAILGTVYGAQKVAQLKSYIAAQLAEAAASKAQLAAAQALIVVKQRQAQIDLRTTQLKIAELQTSSKLMQADAARIAIIKKLNAERIKEAALLKILDTSNKTAVVSTTLMTRATRLLGRALNGLFVGFIAFEVVQILREWSVEFDLWAIAVEAAIAKVGASIGHVLSGDFLDSGATPLEDKLDAIDQKFGEMFDKARRGVESASDRANAEFSDITGSGQSVQEKLAESFKAVKKSLDDNAATQRENLDRQLSEIDRFADQAAIGFERAYKSEVDVASANAQLLIDVNRDKLAAVVVSYGEQLAAIESAYDKEIDAARNKNLKVVGLELDLARAKKGVLGQVEQALANSVNNLLQIEQNHIVKSKAIAQQRVGLGVRTSETLRKINAGAESDTQAQIRRQQERFAIDKQLAAARTALEENRLGEAVELNEKARQSAEELALAEAKFAEEGKSYDLDAIEAKKTYIKAVAQLDQALEAQQKSEAKAAEAAKTQREKQVEQLQGVQALIKDIDVRIQKLSPLKIKVNDEQVKAAINRINSIPTTKTVTIITRNVQANQLGGMIYRNDGGFIPRAGQLPGFGGGDRVKAMLEPGEFIIRKEAVAAYGSKFMERVNAIKEPVKQRVSGAVQVIRRRLGGIIPRFQSGGLVANDAVSKIGSRVLGALSAQLNLTLDINDSDLVDALTKLETKIAEQVEDAQQRFNDSALRVTERAGDLTSRALERYSADLERIQKDSLRFDDSIEDRIRRIQREGFTEEEKRVDIIKQIREKQHAAEQAIADGDVERAARLNAELIALAEQISTESKDAAGNVIVDQETAANQAIGFLRKAQQLNKQIDAEKKRQIESVKQAELAATELEKNTNLEAIEVERQARLQAIEEAKQAELAAIAKATAARQSKSSNSSPSGTAPVRSASSSPATSVANIERQIDLLKSKLGNFSSFGITQRQTDLLAQLRGLFSQRKQIRGFATGGSVPGSGDGDTVPSMLTPGEHVIRKSSVAKYGQRAMEAINQGLLPAGIFDQFNAAVGRGVLPQKFAAGGPVQSGGGSRVTDSIALTLNVGNARAQGVFPADSATQGLIDELKDAGLVNG